MLCSVGNKGTIKPGGVQWMTAGNVADPFIIYDVHNNRSLHIVQLMDLVLALPSTLN